VRITRVDAVPIAVPLAEEFHWAGGAQIGANLVLFSVHTEDGVVGWGESVCEVPAATAEFGRAIARQVVGRRVDDVEGILAEIWQRGRWKTTPQFTQFVVAGIESACWDALGQALDVPTHAVFGGAVHDELDFFGFPQGDDAATLAAAARALSDHEVVYLKIGRPRDDDAVVAAVRDAIGPAKALRVDPNEAWDAATAIERIGRLSVHDLDWVEQPVPHWDVAGLARVREAVRVRIAADQAVYTMPQLERVLDADAADVVVQGPHDAGGLLPFRRQASLCEARGLDVNLHGFVQSEISFLAHAQVTATIPNLTNGHQVMHQLLAERLTTGVDVETPAGKYRLPDGPGHGFLTDEDAVGRAHERFLRDGAYVTIESVAS
jgi:L-alanine-DL-glutamate epimerase-like enolase superfamily enzyme